MKEVIRIPETSNPVEEKPVEFTHYLSVPKGIVSTDMTPKDFIRVVYMGTDKIHGDMFAAYDFAGHINIYKGHLNSGKY